jgi:hypothetical protein
MATLKEGIALNKANMNKTLILAKKPKGKRLLKRRY